VMGTLKALGRPSRAILDAPSVLLAPRLPYRPDPELPYRRGTGAVLELPIATTPLARFPFIGTFAAAFPEVVVRPVYRSLQSASLLNFELHGIDVLGADDGLPPALVRQQRDLAVSSAAKMRRLRKVFAWLRSDREVVTLAAAATRFVDA
jgi:peptidoglycan-N-acetylglucosamine deacetylase